MDKRILIVEDEFVVANALRLTLEQANYTVTGIASSAEEAEKQLQQEQPDFVLLDIHLNGKRSGIDLAKKLNDKNVAFIYLSANSNQTVLEEAKATDPYGFLVKPFREKDLLIALDIALYRQKTAADSRLQQELLLQKHLADISNEKSDARHKLLRLAQAIRVFIPFDLIVSGSRPENAGQFTDSGYLRIGYDEYQYIGENEIMTIAGLSSNKLSEILTASFPAVGSADLEGIADDLTPFSPLQKTWIRCFNINSSLMFSLVTTSGLSVNYCFHSKERCVYTQKHVAVLKLFKSCLIKVTDKMMLPEPGSSSNDAITNDDGKENQNEFKGIIGKHPLLLAALDFATQVAPYNTSVLILGESGTGKEKVAQAIHNLSSRKKGPFIEVNCGAIPPTLIESELFGHEKGAFTGATEKRKGRFEQAEGGTIFLDEIGELPLAMQVKLLRVLQERKINYVGSNSSKKVDVRIVAATNRNLEKEVSDGNFRLDLYYRLNVFPITLPPLRDRKSDILELASFFAHRFCSDFHKKFSGISASMIDAMLAYQWPGNIRELENVLERSVILHSGDAELQLKQHLIGVTTETSSNTGTGTLDDIKHQQRQTEKAYIISILKKTEGKIRGNSGAANLLNLKPTTLESRIAKLGIRREDYSGSTGN
ncbi:sigma 54-interacting response regulator [Pedobacter duraquae]|uniref:Response regulator receiver domain-containing protein n=1 Tax=Pedobacter duraquae TaxID=425511 RepID=A0A4R6IF35_9SPHI|nr:sigma 54-interacting response regulator [Pedobacter duraquae]TDO20288.1 response regulator receiver domain-containing protein [Pedobacter duraquae]